MFKSSFLTLIIFSFPVISSGISVKITTSEKVRFYHEEKLNFFEGERVYAESPRRLSLKLIDEMDMSDDFVESFFTSYIDCTSEGNDKLSYVWRKQSTDRYNLSGYKLSDLYITQKSKKFAVISNVYGGEAILLYGKALESIVTKCPMANISYDVSKNEKYFVLASQQVKSVDWMNANHLIYNLSFDDSFNVKTYDLQTSEVVTSSDIKEDALLDVLVTDSGDYYVLLEERKTNWFNPYNFLVKLAGHSEHMSNVILKKYNNKGELLISQILIKDIRLPVATLLKY
jgi:WD40 repeat protein